MSNIYILASGYFALAYGQLIAQRDATSAVASLITGLHTAGLNGLLQAAHSVIGATLQADAAGKSA